MRQAPRGPLSRSPNPDITRRSRTVARRLGPPPKGFATWSLRLLAEKVVELEVVDSISHETVRQTLKKPR